MAANLLSNNMSSPSGSTTGNRTVDAVDQVSTQVRNQQMKTLMGPMAIFWDIENCSVPAGVRAECVAVNILGALRQRPVTGGAVTVFSAYGDLKRLSRRIKEACQSTGVNLIDVPSKKDAANKAILADMFLFALDNHPPSTIVLISGDVDFAPSLHKLGRRGYTIVLAIPSGVRVSLALCNAGQFVWDWPSIARGSGLVPWSPGCFSSEGSDVPMSSSTIAGTSSTPINVSGESQAMKTEMSKKVQETYSDSDARNNLLLEDAGEHCMEANAVSSLDEGSVDESASVYAPKPEGDQQEGKRNLEKKTRGTGGEDVTENMFPEIRQGSKTAGWKKPSQPGRGKERRGGGRGRQFERQEPRSEAPVGQRHGQRTTKQMVQEAKKAYN